ncbi:MAG: AraC family transcriptional regulator [Lachnospiraceae bacterium]|nr:AraC family transcriptional regulator [Lachnospiraceae bacterium]
MELKFTEKILEIFMDNMRIFNNERQMQRIPLDAEAHILNLIRTGKYQEIKCPPFHRLRDNVGPIARDDLTNYRYLVIASITLFSRAALESGVEPNLIFDSSDSLLYFLSEAKTLEEVHDIYQVAGTYYARQVYLLEQKKLSWQIDKICTYISSNIFDKISISEIAEYTGLSPNYMSNIFKEQMGISIHNYIQKEKTGIACNLLMHTNSPISEIAVYLGFKSQSNFGAVFKKWQHMTPTEYRDKNYREVY